MGGDCCGTEAVEAAFQAAIVEEKNAQSVKNPEKPRKTFKQALAERTPYYNKRIELFEQYRARELDKVARAKEANVAITVTLPDGGTKDGVKDVTTPMDVAVSISKSLAKKVCRLAATETSM
jgi:hypothetical protein